jgi:TolA-binding protein
MKLLLTVLFIAGSFLVTSAQDSDKTKDLEQKILKLEERIALLEGKMVKYERSVVTSQLSNEAKKMEKIAQLHMQEEKTKFNPQDIRTAEDIYMRASALKREGKDSKASLDSIVLMFPKLNRAGCAQLYRAQQESGQEKERLLQDCIERFSTCYYGDGVQVGPFAMFELAKYYQQSGKKKEAKDMFRKLRKEYSGAVGHDGVLLKDKY